MPEEVIEEMFREFKEFIITEPNLPNPEKEYNSLPLLNISVNDNRKQIIDLIYNSKSNSELALLTLYVYRQMDHIDWMPFIKAAIERKPGSVLLTSKERIFRKFLKL